MASTPRDVPKKTSFTRYGNVASADKGGFWDTGSICTTISHPPVMCVPIPSTIAGKLYGGRGSYLNERHLLNNEIDVFISMSSVAFSSGEYWFGESLGWAMIDFHCWPVEVLKRRALEVCAMLRSGKRVLIACTGGHGRTGTLLAAVIALLCPDFADPVGHIREIYCHEAVEGRLQEVAVEAVMGDPKAINICLEKLGTAAEPKSYVSRFSTYKPAVQNGYSGYNSGYDGKGGLYSGSTAIPYSNAIQTSLSSQVGKEFTDDDMDWEVRMNSGYYSREPDGCGAVKSAWDDDDTVQWGIYVGEWYNEEVGEIVSYTPCRNVEPTWAENDDTGEWVRAKYILALNKWYEVPERDDPKLGGV